MPTQNDRSNDEAQIRALIALWADAIRSKNLDTVMSAYAPGALTFDLAPPLQHNTDAIRKQLAEWFPGFNGPIDYEVGENLDIAVSGDVAFSHSLDRMGGRRHSGQEFQIWVRVTMGFRKFLDTWKVTHVHTSVPFYMDGSFRAAVDLAP